MGEADAAAVVCVVVTVVFVVPSTVAADITCCNLVISA